MSAIDWKPFGGDLKDATWDYFCFDLPNSPYKTGDESTGGDGEDAEEDAPAAKGKGGKSAPSLEITLPTGVSANWCMPDFDPKQPGWHSGAAPFGVPRDEMVPSNLTWIAKYPDYPLKRALPKTIVDKDVLLMRKSFDLPPFKDGCRYRIRVDGSIHKNSGEGYAVCVNGKLLAEMKDGVLAFRKQGLRGSHVWNDFRDEFKGGKVTIAVANFPMSNWEPGKFVPVRAPLSIWIEEQQLPPVGD